jgi:hypothetical protein
MFKIKKSFLVIGITTMLFMTSCYTVRTAGNSGKVPPGQAKKRTGAKSARSFAPGQQKKK